MTPQQRRRKRSTPQGIPCHTDPASPLLGVRPTNHSPGRFSALATLTDIDECEFMPMRLVPGPLPQQHPSTPTMPSQVEGARDVSYHPKLLVLFFVVASVSPTHNDVTGPGHFPFTSVRLVPFWPVEIEVQAPTTPLLGILQPIGIRKRSSWSRSARQIRKSVDPVRLHGPQTASHLILCLCLMASLMSFGTSFSGCPSSGTQWSDPPHLPGTPVSLSLHLTFVPRSHV